MPATRRSARRARKSRGGQAARPERASALIVQRLYRTFAMIDRYLSAQLAVLGLNATRWHALNVLDRADAALTMGQLGDILAVRPTNLSGVIKGLSRRGLAARRVNAADRRSAYVAITPRGQSLLRRVLPAHYAALDETMSRLSARERRRLADLLDRVIAPDGAVAGRQR